MEVIVADDGSKDATSALVAHHYGARIRVSAWLNARQRRQGQCASIAHSSTPAARSSSRSMPTRSSLPDTVAKLVRWFANPRVGAVAGNAPGRQQDQPRSRAGRPSNMSRAQNVERRARCARKRDHGRPRRGSAHGGARRLDAVGGYPEDTLAEDQDLTIAIQRAGWWVEYDVEAIALTEAPESFRALGKQRYSLVVRHAAMPVETPPGAQGGGRPRGLPGSACRRHWLFQIVFAALSPLIRPGAGGLDDRHRRSAYISMAGRRPRATCCAWAPTGSSSSLSISIAGWIAYRLEPTRQRFPAFLMIMQRFVYRQLHVWRRDPFHPRRIARTGGRLGQAERTGSMTVPQNQ